MILNFIRLISGFSIGSFAAFFNIKQLEAADIIDLHIAVVNGVLGIVIGVLTIIFLYWQIRKIRRDLKLKKSISNEKD
ncbi:MAG: hypothetical protein QM504_10915 [Pseudomonadota bacterium]